MRCCYAEKIVRNLDPRNHRKISREKIGKSVDNITNPDELTAIFVLIKEYAKD